MLSLTFFFIFLPFLAFILLGLNLLLFSPKPYIETKNIIKSDKGCSIYTPLLDSIYYLLTLYSSLFLSLVIFAVTLLALGIDLTPNVETINSLSSVFIVLAFPHIVKNILYGVFKEPSTFTLKKETVSFISWLSIVYLCCIPENILLCYVLPFFLATLLYPIIKFRGWKMILTNIIMLIGLILSYVILICFREPHHFTLFFCFLLFFYMFRESTETSFTLYTVVNKVIISPLSGMSAVSAPAIVWVALSVIYFIFCGSSLITGECLTDITSINNNIIFLDTQTQRLAEFAMQAHDVFRNNWGINRAPINVMLHSFELVLGYANEQWAHHLTYVARLISVGADPVSLELLQDRMDVLRDTINELTGMYHNMCRSLGYTGIPYITVDPPFEEIQ